MNEIQNMNIPLLKDVLKRQNEMRSSNPTPINDNIIKKNSHFIKDNPELLEKFNEISKELIKMGYSPNLINNLFLIKRFQTLEEAIELLSQNNGKWNHEYLEGDRFICFICEDPEQDHIKNKIIFQPQRIDQNLLKKFHTQGRISIEKEKIVKEEEEIECVIKINMKDCPICFAEITPDNNYKLKCEHVFCRDCIVTYLQEEITNGKIELNCPWKNCENKLEDEEIKNLICEKTFQKLKKFRVRKAPNNDPNLISCPFPDCEGFAKKVSTDQERSNSISGRRSIRQIKHNCNFSHNFCGNCNRVWHGSQSCEDDKEVIDFAMDAGKMLKKCLKCKAWTEKNEGCNHMHCRICETDWCWLCEGLWGPDHYRQPNTPCYGRQFNEFDPDFEYYELLIDQTNFFKSLLFFFVFSFLIINGSIRNVLNPQQDANNRNLNNNLRESPGKFVVFVILFCMLTFGLVFLVLTNGILVMYMFLNLGKLQTVRSNLSKMLCVFSFFLILLVFYPFGITLGCFWFVICLIYSIVKLIQF